MCFILQFGKLKYIRHTVDSYSGFQRTSALGSEKADAASMFTRNNARLRMLCRLKLIMHPHVSSEMQQFSRYYNIKHVRDILYNPTGQAASL